MTIGVLNYGFGNLYSITKALKFLEIEFVLIEPGNREIMNCDRYILPGVGSFEYGIKKIKEDSQLEYILEKINNGTPLLGICLGMQLLFSSSTEGSLNKGLDLIQGNCRPFIEQTNFKGKVPHVGFASLNYKNRDIMFKNILKKPYMYFIHSYMIPMNDFFKGKDFHIATSNHGGTEFISYIRKKNIIGMQYHPEKSQGLGLELIKNFATIPHKKFK